MQFEYDINKSKSNKHKHGIDFEEIKQLWDDPYLVEIAVAFIGESRFIVIGSIVNKHWTAVITYRNSTTRIISVRRSRKQEVDIYDQFHKV